MKTVFILVQILLSTLLVVLIFIQSSGENESRGNILSSTRFEKRGWEKAIFQLTIILLTLFIISSVIQTLI